MMIVSLGVNRICRNVTIRPFHKTIIDLSHQCTNGIKSNDEFNNSDIKLWDIVISGGGLVGSALACALGSSSVLSGRKILLLESGTKTQYDIVPEKYSNRVFAINEGSRALFEGTKTWEKMCSVRVKEVKKLQIWEACSDARLSFNYPGLRDNVAHIIENEVMLQAFNERLTELQSKVQVLRGTSCVDYKLPRSSSNEYVEITLKDGTILKTKLLIGADGYNSGIRQKMGVKYVNWSYNQKAIVATLRLSEPTQNDVAWQRFLPSGPVALLPLSDSLSSLVWTVSVPMYDILLKMSDEEFVDSLNQHLWDCKGRSSIVENAIPVVNSILSNVFSGREVIRQLPPSILSVEPNSRASFPLALGHATEYVAPRVALIGDAAHRVHPLAGQGVNLGFGDVTCLVNCLEDSVYSGNELGDIEPLLDYEVQRQRHVVPSMAAIDALNRLYGTDLMPVVLLRSIGLSVVDSFDWLKAQIVRHAST